MFIIDVLNTHLLGFFLLKDVKFLIYTSTFDKQYELNFRLLGCKPKVTVMSWFLAHNVGQQQLLGSNTTKNNQFDLFHKIILN